MAKAQSLRSLLTPKHLLWGVGGLAGAWLLKEIVFAPPSSQAAVDAGLSDEEKHYLYFALEQDKDPNHLRPFGQSFLPDYPLAASLLLHKAMMLELAIRGHTGRLQDSLDAATKAASDPNRAKADVQRAREWGPTSRGTSQVSGFFDDLLDPFGVFHHSELLDLAESIWSEYHEVVPTEVKILEDIANGKNIPDSIARNITDDTVRAAKAIKVVGPVFAMIPGIGTGVSMALQAGAAIALGEDLEHIAIDTMAGALPGGPAVQNAFRTAANAVVNVAAGKELDAVALELARDGMKSAFAAQFPDVDKVTVEMIGVAFDAGTALAQGQSLQNAGMKTAYRALAALPGAVKQRLPTGELVERTISLTDVAARTGMFKQAAYLAQLQGKDATEYVAEEFLVKPLRDRGYTRSDLDFELRPLIAQMLEHPEWSSVDLPQLIPLVKCTAPTQTQSSVCREISDDLIAAARAAIVEVPGGGVVGNRKVIGKVLPYAPMEIPPAILEASKQKSQSAVLAAIKPIPGRRTISVQDLQAGIAAGAKDMLKLKYDMDRAQAAVQRGKWIQAYKNAEHGAIDIRRIAVT